MNEHPHTTRLAGGNFVLHRKAWRKEQWIRLSHAAHPDPSLKITAMNFSLEEVQHLMRIADFAHVVITTPEDKHAPAILKRLLENERWEKFMNEYYIEDAAGD